jgi:hypothetical protein
MDILKFINLLSSHIFPQMIEQYRKLNGSTSRSCAAISLGFIVIVTPWTIQVNVGYNFVLFNLIFIEIAIVF